jgi:hypothetical protein
MAKVRLIYDMPRTLRDWPPFGTIMELPDDEAENLVYGNWAEYIDTEQDASPAEDDDFDGDFEVDDDFDGDSEANDDFEDGEELEFKRRPKPVKKPRTVDPKSKWLAYAHDRGYDGDDTITKNQLIARYGD